MNKNIFSSNKGTALLMTVLILNSIIIVSLAAAKIVVSGIRMGGTQARSAKAYFAAETGIERVLWEFRKNGLYSGGFPGGDEAVFAQTFLSNNSSYEVNYTYPGVIKFISIGDFNGVKRSVEVELDF